MTNTDRIREMLSAGYRYGDICRELGVASSTVAYHARRIGASKFSFDRTTYDWDEIQKYYDDGNTLSDIVSKFGMNWSSITEAKRRGDFKTDDSNERKKKLKDKRMETASQTPDKNILCVDSIASPTSVKRKIKLLQLIPYECHNHSCSLHGNINPEWAGKKLVLYLDHVNGRRNDNRLENLRWLCPNCHSQTDTYAGKNIKKIGASGGIRTPAPVV